jgi:membrane associated rhomboid family serine protease
MNMLLIWTGRIAGTTGAAMALLAVLLRLSGQWRIGDLQISTLLSGGIAAMVLGTLAYVAFIAESRGR